MSMQSTIHTLPNGISVLIYRDDHAETVCGLVGVGVGSNHEKGDEYGLAHFFEHMCFKGTTTYPSQKDLLTYVDSLGVMTNAFTSHEYTAYYAHGLADRCDDIMQVTADIFLNSLFVEGEVEKEKGVVLEEIAMYEDDPKEKGYESVALSLFTDTPSGHPIIGTTDSVRSFTRERFTSFFGRHYVTGNTVISLAGNVDEQVVLDRLRSLYESAPSGDVVADEYEKPTRPSMTHRSIVREDMEQMRVTIGGYAPSVRDDDRYASMLFSVLFGGSMSSRLFLRVREDMGACYDIAAGDDPQAHTGMHAVLTGVPPSRVDEVVAAIADECASIRTNPVSPEELQRAKDQVSGRLAIARESTQRRAVQQFISFVQTGACESDTDLSEHIASVTVDDIQRVAQRMYDPHAMAICYVGNREVPASCSEQFFSRLS